LHFCGLKVWAAPADCETIIEKYEEERPEPKPKKPHPPHKEEPEEVPYRLKFYEGQISMSSYW
jgi:hypothetical protein